MQVSQQDTHITHAVLGGKNNISFGISDDPAFFQILSSSLYKDPLLAMIRETICNAWDAHIDSGRTDRPLNITLTEDKLVIRDYGKGIPDDLIGPIYAVYGASTKKNDGRQTGGFGLGCKSPFAYTDHFEVISHHEGKRTIYNMSKSSAEKMGKPSIVTIASFPTTETGIQITINLRGDDADRRIHGLIRRVVFNGDISALLNEKLLPKMGLDQAPHGFVLVNNNNSSTELPLSSLSEHNLWVRYGNVIYPIEVCDEIRGLHSKVSNLVHKFYQCRLVLMAPPDSISITPSREALTMSELTVETLKSLLSGFLAHMLQNQTVTKRHVEMVEQYVDTAATTEHTSLYDKLHHPLWEVPGLPTSADQTFFTNLDDFALLSVISRFGKNRSQIDRNKWLQMINRFLNKMQEAGLIPRGRLQSWQNSARKGKKTLSNPTHSSYRYHGYTPTRPSKKPVQTESAVATQWWARQVMKPLLKKLSAASPLIKQEMITYRAPGVSGKTIRGQIQPSPLGDVWLNSHTTNLHHMVAPTVVLCHNKEVIDRRLSEYRRATSVGTYQFNTYFVLEISRQKGVCDAIKAALLDLDDVDVMDLTGRTPREEEDYQDRLKAREQKRDQLALSAATGQTVPVKKKAVEGIVRFDMLARNVGPDGINTRQIMDADAERITQPKFIEQATTKEGCTNDTNHLDGNLARVVALLWGKEGAITNHSGVYNRQLEKGVMDISAFLADRVTNEIATNTDLHAYMGYDVEDIGKYILEKTHYLHGQNLITFYQTLIRTPELFSLVPGFIPLSEENQLRLQVWKGICSNYRLSNTQAVKDAREIMKGTPLCPDAVAFIDGLIKNPFLGLLNGDELNTLISEKYKDPVAMAKIVSIVKLILN